MFRYAFIFLIAAAAPALADDAAIRDVQAVKTGGTWQFDVTVFHADTGWDHYVDAWRILGEDGKVLGERRLAHPHVNEQPFTRSLSGVNIPEGVSQVTVQSRDFPGGWSDNGVKVKLR